MIESPAMAKITFLGAAGTVTGSKYLVEANGKKLLVDCGLFQGPKELRDRNWQNLPIDVSAIDWVVLTHAHIDHTGYIPRLVKSGYKGPFYCNQATHELCNILLLDSAHLQEEEAQFVQKKGYSQHKPALPLYTIAEATTALQQFREIPRADTFKISPEFSVRPHDAGHILGSSWLELDHHRKRQTNSGGLLRRHRALRPGNFERPGAAHPRRLSAVRIHLR